MNDQQPFIALEWPAVRKPVALVVLWLAAMNTSSYRRSLFLQQIPYGCNHAIGTTWVTRSYDGQTRIFKRTLWEEHVKKSYRFPDFIWSRSSLHWNRLVMKAFNLANHSLLGPVQLDIHKGAFYQKSGWKIWFFPKKTSKHRDLEPETHLNCLTFLKKKLSLSENSWSIPGQTKSIYKYPSYSRPT